MASSLPAASEVIKVWVVEDNDLFRTTLQELLGRTEGMTCDHALRSCEELLGVLNYSFAPDVVLMDISLPGMTGVDGVRHVKAIAPSTHVVMVTVHQDNDLIFEAICAGASGYLLKRSPARRIVEAVREVYAGGGAMDPQIARRVLSLFAQLAAPRWEYGLTDREKEVLEQMVEGHNKQQIADRLTVSYHTVDTHVKNIYQKLHVHSRSDAVKKAVQERLL